MNAHKLGTRIARLWTALKSERGRFAIVSMMWAVSWIYVGPGMAIAIALVCVVRYRAQFRILIQGVLDHRWPYNLLALIGVLGFIISPLSTAAANWIVASITNHHPTFTPSSTQVIYVIVFLTLSTLVFTIVVFGAAVLGGFRGNLMWRTFPVAFGLAMPILAFTIDLMLQGSGAIGFFETIIMNLDFRENAIYWHDVDLTSGTKRERGPTVCRDLPWDVRLAPAPGGGFLKAERRETSADEGNRAGDWRRATSYLYGYVSPSECSTTNQYKETP